MPLQLDPRTTALVLIDLENGILAMPVQPHSADDVAAKCSTMAKAFRAHSAPVVYVNVDLSNMLPLLVDRSRGDGPAPPPEASELSLKAGFQQGDLRVTKRHWGAFGLTNLDVMLKERGIETIVFGGIATNMGVESTARQAAAYGFNVIVAEDACSSLSPEMHAFAMKTIFPMLGRVKSSQDIIDALV